MSKMKKLEANNSHYGCWDNRSSSKQFKWLQQNKTDVDAKFKTLLKLIEGDEDLNVQRGESYLLRPQLFKHIIDLHKAYLSLVEHCECLTESIPPNASDPLQIRHGILRDSLKKVPFASQLQYKSGIGTPSSLPKDLSSSCIEMSQQVIGVLNSESESHPQDLRAETQTSQMSGPFPDKTSTSHIARESCSCKVSANFQESESCTDIEYENANEGTEKSHEAVVGLRIKNDILRKECCRLEEANNRLISDVRAAAIMRERLEEETKLLQREKVELRDEMAQEMDVLKEQLHLWQEQDADYRKKSMTWIQQLQNLAAEIEFLRDQKQRLENQVLSGFEQEKYVLQAIQIMKMDLSKCLQRSRRIRKESGAAKSAGWRKSCEMSLKRKDAELPTLYEEVLDLSERVTELLQELSYLQEKDERQRALLVEISEEKREAIRQLCSSMDIINSKNKKLEETIGRYNRHLWNMRALNHHQSSTHSPSWNSLLSFQWMKSNPYALAL